VYGPPDTAERLTWYELAREEAAQDSVTWAFPGEADKPAGVAGMVAFPSPLPEVLTLAAQPTSTTAASNRQEARSDAKGAKVDMVELENRANLESWVCKRGYGAPLERTSCPKGQSNAVPEGPGRSRHENSPSYY
jgi:hypothetical protein